MKAILMSIQPKWCELIFNGRKTIEVRKSFPKQLETPFEVVVYKTRHKGGRKIVNDCLDTVYGGGKVIGSFVCDKITCCQAYYGSSGEKHLTNLFGIEVKQTCLTEEELFNYIVGNKKEGTGWLWHISEFKIYDKSKELSEFYTLGNCEKYDFCNQCKNFHRGQGWLDGSYCDEDSCLDNTRIPVTRAPRSWQYVEELQ